jgi:hypothetical protein
MHTSTTNLMVVEETKQKKHFSVYKILKTITICVSFILTVIEINFIFNFPV